MTDDIDQDINTRHNEKMAKKKAAREKILATKTIEKGLIMVHTGKGKGKSTAAMGLAMRAIGNGMKVGIVQFVKGVWATGERDVLDTFPDLVTIKAMGEGFTWETQDRARDVAAAEQGWQMAQDMINDDTYKMVILDELNIVLRYDYLPIAEVVKTLLAKPEGVDVKIGDCDDLTMLYASLLENLSIDTAFLEANAPGKGHIYLMFDSGISPEKAEDHFLSSAEYVVWQGRVWIPIETTMFGFTFADAWRNGVAEYKRLKVRKLIDEVYVQQWLQIYKPASLPPINVTLPASGEMDSLLFRDLDYFDQRVDQIALGSATSLDTPDGAYDAGAAYLRINHLEKALKMFDKALEMRSDHLTRPAGPPDLKVLQRGAGKADTGEGAHAGAHCLRRERVAGGANQYDVVGANRVGGAGDGAKVARVTDFLQHNRQFVGTHIQRVQFVEPLFGDRDDGLGIVALGDTGHHVARNFQASSARGPALLD